MTENPENPENNFYMTKKKNDILSFDIKSRETRKIREIENDNFDFTKKCCILFYLNLCFPKFSFLQVEHQKPRGWVPHH